MVVLGGVGNSEMIFLSYTGEYIRLDAVGNREISGSVYTVLDFKKASRVCCQICIFQRQSLF